MSEREVLALLQEIRLGINNMQSGAPWVDEYKLVASAGAAHLKEFESHIQELVNEGWQPLGGPAIKAAPPGENDVVLQALIRWK